MRELVFFIAFFKVVVICDCPTTVEKFCGLILRAETMNLSMVNYTPTPKGAFRTVISASYKNQLFDIRNGCLNKETLNLQLFINKS